MVDSKQQQFLRQCIEAFFFGYREFTAQPDRILGEMGLNRVHHRILYFIGQNPGVGVGELLKILQVSKQALNPPLRQLLELGLVENTAGVVDRRAKHLNLTHTGTKLESQLTQVQMKLLRNTFDQCGKNSDQLWLSVMKTMFDQAGSAR